MEKNKIGKEIKKYRKLKKMSQEELAKAVGLNGKNIISRFENGKCLPALEKTLPKICEVLGIDYDINFNEIQI